MHRYMNCMLKILYVQHNIYISKALVLCTVYGLGLKVDITHNHEQTMLTNIIMMKLFYSTVSVLM